MTILNFPTSPSLNDTYSFGGKTWVWNGQGWQLQTQGAINGIVIGNSTPAAGTFTTLSATGNTTSGNILTGGLISATGNINGNYFIGNGSQLTGIAASGGGGNLWVVGRVATYYTPIINGILNIIGRTGNISVPINT